MKTRNPSAPRWGRPRRALAGLALPALLVAVGCGAPPTVADTDGTFHDSLRTYANLVRWGELDSASRFVHRDQRADFVALTSDLERLRFTDFDVGPVRYGENGAWARVKVVYHVYDVSTLVEQRIVDEQVWYAESRRDWTVWPDLASFQKVLGLAVDAKAAPSPLAAQADPAPSPAKAAFEQ